MKEGSWGQDEKRVRKDRKGLEEQRFEDRGS